MSIDFLVPRRNSKFRFLLPLATGFQLHHWAFLVSFLGGNKEKVRVPFDCHRGRPTKRAEMRETESNARILSFHFQPKGRVLSTTKEFFTENLESSGESMNPQQHPQRFILTSAITMAAYGETWNNSRGSLNIGKLQCRQDRIVWFPIPPPPLPNVVIFNAFLEMTFVNHENVLSMIVGEPLRPVRISRCYSG